MKLSPLKKVRNNHPDVFQVTWIINDICSNSCSYCLPALFAGTNHGYDWNNAKMFVKHILDTKKDLIGVYLEENLLCLLTSGN